MRRLVEEKSAIGSLYGAIGGICVDSPLNQYYYKKRIGIQGKITMFINFINGNILGIDATVRVICLASETLIKLYDGYTGVKFDSCLSEIE